MVFLVALIVSLVWRWLTFHYCSALQDSCRAALITARLLLVVVYMRYESNAIAKGEDESWPANADRTA